MKTKMIPDRLRRLLAILLSVLLCFNAVAVMAFADGEGGEEPPEDPPEECEHDYQLMEIVDGNCNEEGYEYYECPYCGDSYNDYTGYGDHQIVDGVCIYCGLTEEQVYGEHILYEGKNEDIAIYTHEFAEYTFTAVNSGFFTVYSEGNHDIWCRLYHGEDIITEDDDNGTDFNFKFTAYLTAGETYAFDIETLDDICLIDFYIIPSTFDTLSEGENTNVSVLSGMDNYYEFTPETSGDYLIYSETETDLDSRCTIYYQGEQITYNEDGGEGRNFRIETPLEAGETYVLALRSWSGNIEINVVISNQSTVNEHVLCEGVNEDVYVYNSGYSEYTFTAETSGTYLFYSDNNTGNEIFCAVYYNGSDIASGNGISQNGCDFSFKANNITAGETYTVKFFSYDDSCTIDVYIVNISGGVALSEGANKDIYISPDYDRTVTFTPSESGTYTFYSDNHNGPDPKLGFYENGGFLFGDDDGGGDRNFRFTANLEAGKTYTGILHSYSSDTAPIDIYVVRAVSYAINISGSIDTGKLRISTDDSVISDFTNLTAYNGDYIYLDYNTGSDQSVTGWTVTDENGDEVEVTLYNSYWRFAMPRSDVTIESVTLADKYIIYTDIDNSDIDFTATYANGEYIGSHPDGAGAPAGAEVMIVFVCPMDLQPDMNKFALSAYSTDDDVDFEVVPSVGKGYPYSAYELTFTMPADDVTAAFGFKAKTYDSITVGLNEIEAESDIGSYFYSFTPEKSGIYVFASDDIQPFYVTVTDDYGSTLVPYDFDNQDEFKLTRGNTYYVRATMNGLSEAELAVSLLEEIQDYNVTVANVSHGTITVNPKVAFEGDYIEINYEPDGSYGLTSVTVTDADDNEIALLDSNALQFVMPASDVTVSATFGKAYNITVTGDKVFGAAISSELVNYDPYSVSEMAAGTEVCVLPNIHPAYSLDMFEVTTASGEIVQASLRDVSAGMGGLVPIIQPTEPEWAIVFTMPSEDVIVEVYAEEDDVIVLEENVPSSFTYDSSNNKAIFKFVPEESGTYNISGISSSETAYFLYSYIDGKGIPLVGDETIPGGRDINATFSVSKGTVCYAVIHSFYSTATLTVTATKTASLDDNDITVDASLGGTITAPASAVYKERVCINVAPDANFTCDDIIITGDVTGTHYDVSEYYGRYVFEMPDEAVTLSGVFTAVPVLVGHSLTLAGDIGLNFYFYYADASEDDFVVFSFNGKQTIVPIDLNNYDDETGAYKFTFNVAAADAAEDILCWYESPTAYSEDDYYSVNQYIAESGSINDDNLRNLMGSLAEYCYRANRLFKPESDFTKAEVEGYSDTIDSFNLDLVTECAPEFHDFEGGVNYVGMSLVLRTKTALRIYFSLPEGKSIDDYAFTADCPNTGTSLDLNPVKKGYLWYIEISDIASAELDNYYYITVVDESGNPVNSWKVSALSYVCQVLERANDFSEELVNTCKALAKYNEYANMYFNA